MAKVMCWWIRKVPEVDELISDEESEPPQPQFGHLYCSTSAI